MNASNTSPHFYLHHLARGAAGCVFSALLTVTAAANAQIAPGTTGIDARRAGKVDNAGGQFQANAMQRCNVLPSQEKIECEARVLGYGNSQGSVAGGGVITEIETVVMPNNPGAIKVQP